MGWIFPPGSIYPEVDIPPMGKYCLGRHPPGSKSTWEPEFYSVCHTKAAYEEQGPGICRHNPVFGTMTDDLLGRGVPGREDAVAFLGLSNGCQVHSEERTKMGTEISFASSCHLKRTGNYLGEDSLWVVDVLLVHGKVPSAWRREPCERPVAPPNEDVFKYNTSVSPSARELTSLLSSSGIMKEYNNQLHSQVPKALFCFTVQDPKSLTDIRWNTGEGSNHFMVHTETQRLVGVLGTIEFDSSCKMKVKGTMRTLMQEVFREKESQIILQTFILYEGQNGEESTLLQKVYLSMQKKDCGSRRYKQVHMHYNYLLLKRLLSRCGTTGKAWDVLQQLTYTRCIQRSQRNISLMEENARYSDHYVQYCLHSRIQNKGEMPTSRSEEASTEVIWIQIDGEGQKHLQVENLQGVLVQCEQYAEFLFISIYFQQWFLFFGLGDAEWLYPPKKDTAPIQEGDRRQLTGRFGDF
ncbi:unnamed protein product [Darwinula stevensoni]|uniref:Uncharacterized protein n=1 Tax=Darwinula stevensoni TaxID=69355 RepID=A0A7R8X800_9CRUS|nr:unnamed protein product [Darwinula stevensoni]CAG0881070.1 unnamed protein product [Darwinula stevensoni]